MRNIRYIRFGVAFVVLALAVAGVAVHGGIGTLCALCPVGFLEMSVGSGEVAWGLLPGVVAVIALAVFLGRAFCAWICPTSALRNLFGGHKPHGLTGRMGEVAERRSGSDLRVQGMVLAVALAVSLVVHFPVFCLFCPIGIAFGILFAISKLFITWQAGWELIVYPLMLVAELFLFRRWCAAICPLGFLFGAAARLGTAMGLKVRPRSNGSTCICQGGCHACASTCPEDIDVAQGTPEDFEDCTLCLECMRQCPTKSISVRKSK